MDFYGGPDDLAGKRVIDERTTAGRILEVHPLQPTSHQLVYRYHLHPPIGDTLYFSM